MNLAILTVTAFVSILLGVVIHRVYRSLWAGLAFPVVITALVWFGLPQTGIDTPESIPVETIAVPTHSDLEPYRPIEVPSHGYVGSEVCKDCHLENHASWYASYHRSMTQVATPDAIIGDFNDVVQRYRGNEYEMTREGEVCFVDMPDLNNPSPTARTHTPVVMTTGSHHMQLYWFATGARRMIGLLPWAYLVETQEWIPRDAVFLRPRPIHSFETGRWNQTCSRCHSTHRMGRFDERFGWDTQVGEFGISCEACHGPGAGHVQFRKQKNAAHANSPDPIVNPVSLPKERSVEVCGQCHSIFFTPRSIENADGSGFVPGNVLADSHLVVRRNSPEYVEQQAAMHYPTLEMLLNESYYNDGMVRVSGREFNGVTDSACFQKGEMTCFSCHQLHQPKSDPRTPKEWANDQLQPDALGDSACTQCHQQDQYAESHTHHASGSSGSLCYNCHMPHTTYGLLKAIRSHTISSPNIGKDRDAGRPNACNLCHLDKTLAWASGYLNDWYDIDPPSLDHDESTVAASLLWLLKGNAANRALATWSMGWDDAQSVSGREWQTPFLAQSLDDDYEALRLIAKRSLRSMPGLEELQMDVVKESTSASRQQRIRQILDQWSQQIAKNAMDRPELLVEQSKLRIDRVDDLRNRRDNTPMSLAE
ncbi:MAG: hypothetical protein KDB00_11195 [Planctomycetales bacterium]|nr:hypothetical protein [Planctomycetales bacterium]